MSKPQPEPSATLRTSPGRTRVPKRSDPFASIWFFPLAAAYAAVLLPWSVLALYANAPAPPGLSHSVGHAHEMLFGYAMAVVAGYVLGPQRRSFTFILLSLWILSRLTALWLPASIWNAVFNGLFAVMLVSRVVPRFLRSAKKWRNKAVAPLIIGLGLSVLGFHALDVAGRPGLQHALLWEVVLLLTSLMFFMGGRMIAPAVAGHLLKRGRDLEARVQPRVEGAGLIAMGLVLTLNLVPMSGSSHAVGILLIVTAILILIRTLRWRLWLCWDRPDLLALGVGYLWLSVGTALAGSTLLTPWIPLSTALHGLTIGALGTLTLTVMARTRLHRTRRDPNAAPIIYVAAALVSLAAFARLMAGTALPAFPAHIGAALSWSLAFMILLFVLLREAFSDGSEARRRRVITASETRGTSPSR